MNINHALSQAQQALEAGERDRAKETYQDVLRESPGEPRALFALARLSYEAGDFATVEKYVRRGIEFHPREPVFHNILSSVCQLTGRIDEAVAAGRTACKLHPNSFEFRSNLGLMLLRAGKTDDAMAAFRKSIALQPNYGAHYNLANALVQAGDFAEAEGEFQKAIQLAPANYETYNNLGLLYRKLGRLSESLEMFDAALRLRPDAADAHRNRALHLLLLGDYAHGWPEFEWRAQASDYYFWRTPFPRWKGESLAGRTLMLAFEQGIGDAIQFVRFATLLKRQHPDARLILRCPNDGHRLFSTVAGLDGFVGENLEGVTADFHLPLLSCPLALGTTLETIPADVPYLAAEPALVERWGSELAGERQFKVGIAWQGNPHYQDDRFRSMALVEFAPLAACRGVKLYSLQKQSGVEQLAAVASSWNIEDLGGRIDLGDDAFIDTAAVMRHLDLVITCDTSICHLAGALGVPVWTAVDAAGSWRWLLDRDDTPWYPTMRLFRQSRLGQWGDVFARMAVALQEAVARRATA